MTRTLLLAVAAAAAATAVPATAEQRVVSTTVHFADLNLTSAADRVVLNDRLGTAIRRMCRAYGKQTDAEQITAEGCVAEARADAEAKLGRLNGGAGSVEVMSMMR
ncbi:UrcA family protein [Sphingomonas sp. BGYR3]|uniref:UrcA family protein n=1 Tax=Sphingomonas sp. BGYR3 TaxID=2975483 RepID=UPI0021A57C75|nr:UrcA family protein [Sphingomonas sp. BGYR3]MDG5488023.1 UrcA family protein [Sphingomonas sp. BGYR3]